MVGCWVGGQSRRGGRWKVDNISLSLCVLSMKMTGPLASLSLHCLLVSSRRSFEDLEDIESIEYLRYIQHYQV